MFIYLSISLSLSVLFSFSI
jgi:hypothetical protein